MTRLLLCFAVLVALSSCAPPSDRRGCNVQANPLGCSI